MTRPRRNYDIPELRRLDVAHHLPAQQDWQLIEDLGGSRIITSADACTIMDGEGNQLLDGMAAVVRQCRLRPRRARRCRGRADARAAVLQHFLQDRDAARGAPRRKDFELDPGPPAACLFQHVGVGGQ